MILQRKLLFIEGNKGSQNLVYRKFAFVKNKLLFVRNMLLFVKNTTNIFRGKLYFVVSLSVSMKIRSDQNFI